MSADQILDELLLTLIKEKPYLTDFFSALAVSLPKKRITLRDFLGSVDEEHLERMSLDRRALVNQCIEFVIQMDKFKQTGNNKITEIRIERGFDKSGNPEKHDLLLRPGEVTAVVGPTGSGKSRLLGDIECLAQGDTPTGRRVLLNGETPDDRQRFAGEHQLVAQLSQNMNFVMDLSVRDFLEMHAGSRLIDEVEERVSEVFSLAIELAGEPFSWSTPVTALSGGQSRALMIADVACLSSSPIVLIDEIENAGVDRTRALDLLVEEDKIVLLATHDPLLALSAQRRLIIQNGAISAIIETSETEKNSCKALRTVDEKLSLLREQVRNGQRVVFE